MGLIAKLTSVSCVYVVGPQHVNIKWNKVGIGVLTRFLKEAGFKIAAWVLYFIFDSINEIST